MKRQQSTFALLIFFICLLAPGLAYCTVDTAIDFNDFFAEPDTSVTISSDGSSALIIENPNLSSVLLTNDPFFGDPNVIIPGVGVSLVFEIDFIEAVNNDDEFSVFVLDSDSGVKVGPEFVTQSSSKETISFDLSSLSGKTLGLQFELNALLSDPTPTGIPGQDSTAFISNLHLAVIPIPSAFLLFFCGLFSLIKFRKKNSC